MHVSLFILAEFRVPRRPLQFRVPSFTCFTCKFTSSKSPPVDQQNRQCRHCLLAFHSKPELFVHLIMAHGKMFAPFRHPMVCQLCVGEPFKHCHPEAFCKHRYNVHEYCMMHIICENPSCTILLPSEGHLKEHHQCMSLYSGDSVNEGGIEKDMQYMCFTCKLTYNQPPQPQPQCPFCMISFHQNPDLRAHLHRNHGETSWVRNPHECELCGFTDRDPEKFCQHRLKEHRYCLLHMICGNPSCSILLPSVECLKEHVAKKRCMSFKYVQTPPEIPPRPQPHELLALQTPPEIPPRPLY